MSKIIDRHIIYDRIREVEKDEDRIVKLKKKVTCQNNEIKELRRKLDG